MCHLLTSWINQCFILWFVVSKCLFVITAVLEYSYLRIASWNFVFKGKFVLNYYLTGNKILSIKQIVLLRFCIWFLFYSSRKSSQKLVISKVTKWKRPYCLELTTTKRDHQKSFACQNRPKKLNNKGANSWQMTWRNATCVQTNRERERKRGEFFSGSARFRFGGMGGRTLAARF